MGLSINKISSPTQIGDVAFWFDYFNSPTTEGDSGAGYFKSIIDNSFNAYDLKTETDSEEFEDEGSGFQVNEGCRMACLDETASEFAFLHQSNNTVMMRVKHADFDGGAGNAFYYATGRGNEQSIQMNYELANERRRIYIHNGIDGVTNVERPYQDNKYPVDIQEDVYFNLFVVVDHTSDLLRFLTNAIQTVEYAIGGASVNNPRFALKVGGTDTATSLNSFVWSQLIAFNKVLTDSQIQQLNSFFNNYNG